jgi:hypothetical protein
MNAEQKIACVLASPVYSFWLKMSLNTAMRRDMCDAASDAVILAQLLLDQSNEALGLPKTKLVEVRQ